MNAGAPRILLIDCDHRFAVSLSEQLRRVPYGVTVVGDGESGLAEANSADLVLLELALPDIDGTDVCRLLRDRSNVPILVVSSRARETSRVELLNLGADDYVVKPVMFGELNARIRAVLRRSGRPHKDDEIIDCGPIQIDGRSRVVRVMGNPVHVTRREFDLFARLARDAGRVVLRDQLYEDAWNAPAHGRLRTLDTHVGALRRKLGDHCRITTLVGVGYRLDPTPVS